MAGASFGEAKPGTLKTTLPVSGIHTGGSFVYGGSAVDSAASRYFLADRTNAALDVFDTKKLKQIAQVKDNFVEPGAVVVAAGNIYVGDAGSVHVIEQSTLTPARRIRITAARSRTDDGCFDPDDNLLMLTNPGDTPPFVTWISTRTNTVYTQLSFKGTANAPTAVNFGGCAYDSKTKRFYLNNSGSTANVRGELDVITAKSVVAKAPSVSAAFSQRRCGPTGLVLGANARLFVACESSAGVPGQVLFMRTDGTVVKSLTTTGGGDKVAYDPLLDRYYCACFDRWSSGITGAGTMTPVLGIVDGATMKLIVNAPTAQDAKSVSVDPKTRNVFVPVAPTATFSGGIMVYTP